MAAALPAESRSRRASRKQGRDPAGGRHSAMTESDDESRGRGADRPSEMPALGWKDILIRVWKNIGSDRVVVISAGVAFYIILALFPAIAALVSLYGFFADPTTISNHLNSLAGILPQGAIDVVGGEITRVVSQGQKSLGPAFIVGLLAAIWSANAGMKALFDALNLVYDERGTRGLIKLNLISLAFTTGAIVFLMISLGAIVVLPLALGYLGLSGQATQVANILRWPALVLVVGFA